jgi:beta-lactamase superfamily II metal-dependent hydrolase
MPSLKVAFLDVGHGDFAFSQTPLGDYLVIDMGTGDVVPSRFLSKVATISELQVSHPHTDHFDDIVEMSKKTISSFRCPNLDRFEDKVIGWRKNDKVKIAKLREMKSKIAANNGAVRSGSGFTHTVWFADNIDYKDPNTASAVTTLAYQGVKFLFGGDLPSAGWENLLQKANFVSAISGTSVFKVPHHGRKEGCCQALFDIQGFKPYLCVISDKPIEKDSKNTVATDWYSKRAAGCNVVGYEGKRSVLTTRSDGSIFVQVNEKGEWWIYPNTQWKND